MIKLNFKIISLILIFTMTVTSFGILSVFAEEENAEIGQRESEDNFTISTDSLGVEDADVFDYLFTSSLIMYDGESKYYRYGISDNILANGKPCPMFKKNGVSFMSALSFESTFGLDLSWNLENETLTLKKNDTIVSIRIGEDAINVNGELKYNTNLAYYLGDAVMVPMGAVLQHFGYKITEKDKFTFVNANDFEFPELTTKTNVKLNELFESFYLNADFENGQNGFSFASNWGGTNSGHGLVTDTDNSCLYMNVTETGWEGYQSDNIYRGTGYDIKDASYIVEFSYLVSEDFVGNTVGVGVFAYDGTTFKNFFNLGTVPIDVKGKWIRKRFCISSKSLPKIIRAYNHDSFRLIFTVNAVASASAIAGKVYIDDVQITGYNPVERYIDAGMHADKYAAWYIMGDDVSYSPIHPERIENAQSVTGTVYNLEGTAVDTVTYDIKTILEKGWKWTPKDNGWYEVAFQANYSDGSNADLITLRTTVNSGDSYGDIIRERPSFFVAPTETKPMSDRNDTLYYQSSNKDPDKDYHNEYHRLAMELMGFKGCRFWIEWGQTADKQVPAVEDTKDVYDWTAPEQIVETCKKNGIENVIVSIGSTPKWAAPPAEEMLDANGNQLNPDQTTVIGRKVYNNYVAKNIEDYEEFLYELAKRYHDTIDVWEIWNEPSISQNAFWYDSPENYIKMLKSSCKVIRSVDDDALISVAGMGKHRNYLAFMDRLLEIDSTILDDIDYWAVHGGYLSMDGVTERLVAAGHADMPYINTEAYFASRSQTTDYSKTLTAMDAVINYLSAYKENVSRLCLYDILNTTNEEESVDYGIFRCWPFIEPKESAATIYTLMDLMEKDFAYQAEYETANGHKVVLCKNGKGNLVAVWNPDGNEENIDSYLLECMTETSKIISADGRIKTDKVIPTEHLIYITDLDINKLDLIKGEPDVAINGKYVIPVYRCMTAEELEQQDLSKLISMGNAKIKPFDENTFAIADNVVWIEDNYEWKPASGTTEKPVGYSAKHAAYINEKGLWLMVDVTDSDIVDSTSHAALWKTDSVQFALKVSNDAATPMHEFSAGLAQGKPVVYKEIAANAGTDMPPGNYTKAKNVVENAKVSIEKTNHGLLYKIHLPADQLWPYSYLDTDEYIRFSLCVNNNNGSGRIGWLQWGSGIASGGKDASLYGKIDFK